jgi:ubiquitin carboxyl-terminal hydrolase L3
MMTSDSTSERQCWLPLANDTDLLNSYMHNIGFDTSLYKLTYIFELSRIPQPVAAVILLYPLTDVQKEYHKREQVPLAPDDVWFIKVRIGNACGTIALLHAIFNAPEGLRSATIRPDSWLHSFYQDCPLFLPTSAKAAKLEGDSTIKTLHNEAATDASNQTSPYSGKTISHYVALVHVNGGLYELDGCKKGPLRHGDTSQETLLEDACKVVKKFKDRDPHEMRFTVMALAPNSQQYPCLESRND